MKKLKLPKQHFKRYWNNYFLLFVAIFHGWIIYTLWDWEKYNTMYLSLLVQGWLLGLLMGDTMMKSLMHKQDSIIKQLYKMLEVDRELIDLQKKLLEKQATKLMEKEGKENEKILHK